MIDFLRIINDDISPCGYLAGQVARLPMCMPTLPITRGRFDELMEAGYRRAGSLYYKTQCPACSACEPLRLDVQRFQLSRSFRRIVQRTSQLRFELGEPEADERRVELFNLHRRVRKLSRSESDLSLYEYQSFLMNAPNPSLELRIWQAEELVSVAITDIGQNCLSAVYCYFNPDLAELSLGTLSILKQIEFAQANSLQWLYLGFYVAANQHLCYKARFKPHQRRVGDRWLDFE